MAAIFKADDISNKSHTAVDYVSGLNTLVPLTEWLFKESRMTVYEAWVRQYVHYVKCLRVDKQFLSAHIYAYTSKEGDQRNYSLIAHKTFLDALAKEDDLYIDDEVIPVETPPVSEVPPLVITPVHYVRTTASLRVRSGPGTTYSVITTLAPSVVVPVAKANEDIARDKIGKDGWIQIMVDDNTFGWLSSLYVVAVEVNPPLDWQKLMNLTDRQKKIVAACVQYNKDPYGDVAHNLKELVAVMANCLDKW